MADKDVSAPSWVAKMRVASLFPASTNTPRQRFAKQPATNLPASTRFFWLCAATCHRQSLHLDERRRQNHRNPDVVIPYANHSAFLLTNLFAIRPPALVWPLRLERHSCGKQQIQRLRHFAVLKAVGKNTQCQGFYFGDGLFACVAVNHGTR